jgi:hypothetical protein
MAPYLVQAVLVEGLGADGGPGSRGVYDLARRGLVPPRRGGRTAGLVAR